MSIEKSTIEKPEIDIEDFEIDSKETYRDNPLLKKAGVKIEYTQEQVDEYIKCAKDPIYFAENYIKIVNVDEGLMNFKMWPFQEEMINLFKNNRFVITKCPRQVGKTTTAVAYLLWVILFQDAQNIAILANKGKTSRDILGKLQLAYENLPLWLQQGVVEWNKGKIELENEAKELKSEISKLTALLKSDEALRAHVSEELGNVSKKFATPRRTIIA